MEKALSGRTHVPHSRTVPVSVSPDVRTARDAARDMAAALGFDQIHAEEIAIAVSELASNLIKHTIDGGELQLTPIGDQERKGIQVTSLDNGPGIADAEAAIADGVSSTGSLGYGLGAVNRLMDTLEIGRREDRPGSLIVCTRWIRHDTYDPILDRVSIGVASRPHPMMAVNGDAFVVKKWGTQALVGVIDGLGHGEHAHQAAQQARQYVVHHCDQPLSHLFRGVGRVCRGSRGVVMALARVDLAHHTLSFASIGNVEARMHGNAVPANFVIRRGILGAMAPQPVVTDHPWPPGCILALQSDGVATRWRWRELAALEERPAEAVAWQILRQWGKEDDDATVVVVKSR